MFSQLTQNQRQKRLEAYAERLATVVKRTRLEAGISRNELSALSGVSRPTISEIEEGKTSPTVGTLMRLIYALESNCETLFTSVESLPLDDNDNDKNSEILEEPGSTYLKKPQLDEPLEKAFSKLRRKSKNNPDLRATILDLSRLQVIYPKNKSDEKA